MKLLFLLLFFSFSNASDELIRALTQGTFTYKKAEIITTDEDKTEQAPSIGFHYKSLSLYGLHFEVENDGLNAYAKAFYSGTFSDFAYVLSIHNHIASTQTYAMDINYNLRRELSIGSRYTIESEATSVVSYTGIYSSILLDEISKGLNIGLSYDKAGLDKKGNNFNINFKSEF